MTSDTNPAATAKTDPFEQFKSAQRAGWAHFGPLAMFTCQCAPRLVRFAGVKTGQRMLDVGSGTGVVAVTAARLGARVTGSDLTPELIQLARESSHVAGVDVEWKEADVENLPFNDAQFDVVTSQFGHMFAPRPLVAVAEMLRVLKPGGTIAFSTWPPDHLVGRTFSLVARYAPPPPPGVSSPVEWGEPGVIRERLGAAVRDLTFERDTMTVYSLSPQHSRAVAEQMVGPVIRLVQVLGTSDPAKLAEFRREYDALTEQYFELNTIRQSYLMARAVKI